MSAPQVAIVMGSESDWEVMRGCKDQLQELGLACVTRVLSAHRSPDDLRSFVASAPEQGLQVFVAAAGMSAALAGTIAAHTTLPVIGVPIESGALRGLDALLSTVQMPPGVPVAAMAVGRQGARNAAIMAAEILALQDPGLEERLRQFKQRQVERVREQDRKLR